MIWADDLEKSWHLVYFYAERACYLWTLRRLPNVYQNGRLSKSHFQVCVRYENLSDQDINDLFKRFYPHPIEITPNYCSFHRPDKTQPRKKKEPVLSPGLQHWIDQQTKDLDQRARERGSQIGHKEVRS